MICFKVFLAKFSRFDGIFSQLVNRLGKIFFCKRLESLDFVGKRQQEKIVLEKLEFG
jgi:hypothetical protein